MKIYGKPDYVDNYDFYRCMKCNGLITHMEMTDRVPLGKVCPCGGLKYAPVDPKWYQFFKWSVIRFAFYRLLRYA